MNGLQGSLIFETWRRSQLRSIARSLLRSSVVLGTCGLLGACAGGATGPSAVGFSGGISNCQAARAELNHLDAQGVPNKIVAAQAGSKVSPQTRAQIDRYNELLNVYLGNQCHVKA
jgi:uncharacterized protein YgbK (DUF1537 family)